MPLVDVAAALGTQAPLALAAHAAAMALAGVVYGRLFGRAANDRRGGWLFGIGYGYLLWMLGPAGLLPWVLVAPVATGSAARGLLVAQLLHGLALGVVFPFVHKRLLRRLPLVREPPRTGVRGVARRRGGEA